MYSLSQINYLIKDALNSEFSEPVWVCAEIMEMNVNSTGHCYIELVEKDPANNRIVARQKAVIFANTFPFIKMAFESTCQTQLQRGLKVLLSCTIEYHIQYGMSFIVNNIDPSYTIGDMAQRRKEILLALQAEDLIDRNKKLLLPLVPKRIAVISSDTAAGYGDFVNQLQNNNYGYKFEITLFSAMLQGDQCEGSVVNALNRVEQVSYDFDVVVLIRGGGSVADLASFDNYKIAYTITQLSLPLLCGIGHERDNTVVDEIANRSLKTPTAVAEFIIDLAYQYESKIDSLIDLVVRRSKERMVKEQSRVDTVIIKIPSLSKNLLLRHRSKIDMLNNKLVLVPRRNIDKASMKLDNLPNRLNNAVKRLVEHRKIKLEMVSSKLYNNDPARLLEKGYSISTINGVVIKSMSQITNGDAIEIRYSDGTAKAIINN